MDPQYRNAFNAAFTDEIYRRYERDLSTRLNSSFEFRLAETPVFLPAKLRGQLVTAATGILEQLSRPENIEKMKAAIPDRWRAPSMDALPSLTQIDFAVVRDSDGELAPRLIELQGFPSLTAMQVVQRDAWVDVLRTLPGLDQDWSCWFSGLTREAFLDLARATIVGTHDPAEVLLLDIDPPTQNTSPDFVATKLLFGVDAIDPRELRKRGARLYRNVDGREIPVRRIYNRVVFDELERKQIPVPFSYQDEL